jgi:hypothetical protein
MFNIIFPLRFNFLYSKKLVASIKTCRVKIENICHNYFCYKNKWIILEYKKRTRYKEHQRPPRTNNGIILINRKGRWKDIKFYHYYNNNERKDNIWFQPISSWVKRRQWLCNKGWIFHCLFLCFENIFKNIWIFFTLN